MTNAGATCQAGVTGAAQPLPRTPTNRTWGRLLRCHRGGERPGSRSRPRLLPRPFSARSHRSVGVSAGLLRAGVSAGPPPGPEKGSAAPLSSAGGQTAPSGCPKGVLPEECEELETKARSHCSSSWTRGDAPFWLDRPRPAQSPAFQKSPEQTGQREGCWIPAALVAAGSLWSTFSLVAHLPSRGGSHPATALQPSQLGTLTGSLGIFCCPLSLEADGAGDVQRHVAPHCVPCGLTPFGARRHQPRLPWGVLRASIWGVCPTVLMLAHDVVVYSHKHILSLDNYLPAIFAGVGTVS